MTPSPRAAAKQRKHALAGHGPIVDRARQALRHVAGQFGEVTASTDTSVEVRTEDGIELTLSYDPGNYIFSRVYNLTISVDLPTGSPVPAGLELSHRDRAGAKYVAAGSGSGSRSAPGSGSVAPGALRRLNEAAAAHLNGIDLHSSRTSVRNGRRSLTLTPLGGSFVWVLIPPVFKATAFPKGEPARILDLIRAIRGLAPATASAAPAAPVFPQHP